MNATFTFETLGTVRSCYKQKFGIPRQAGLSPSASAVIEISAPYSQIEAFEALSTSSHIWVQFVFHESDTGSWKTKVKAPRLGGNKSISVFATRSPNRPNPIGLSAVRLHKIECVGDKIELHISGGDFLDGTPVLDIKPYVPYCDVISDATNSFADAPPGALNVEFSEIAKQALSTISDEGLAALIVETLELNPAPQYLKPEHGRRFHLQLHEFDIEWVLESNESIRVENIRPV